MSYSWTQRKEGGAIIVTDRITGKSTTQPTLTCCHCNKVWIPIHGSGRVRGFCLRCMKPTCGDAGCNECYPFEKRLDDFEKGRLKVLK